MPDRKRVNDGLPVAGMACGLVLRRLGGTISEALLEREAREQRVRGWTRRRANRIARRGDYWYVDRRLRAVPVNRAPSGMTWNAMPLDVAPAFCSVGCSHWR